LILEKILDLQNKIQTDINEKEELENLSDNIKQAMFHDIS
jgi:hypothetical protein